MRARSLRSLAAATTLACAPRDDAAGTARDSAPASDAERSSTAEPPRDGGCGLPPAGDTLPPRMRRHLVSDGSRGMATAVRWARSPDGCTLLVVEDPVSVEAEPVPDVVTIVRERDARVRLAARDSVWDVAPDRAWRRLALGLAHVAVAREAGDTLPTRAWAALARVTRLPEAIVRAAAFPSSDMAVAHAVAQPAVWTLDSALTGALPRALPLLGGWRVRWAAGDSALLVGSGPARAAHDDAPSARWMRVDAASGRPMGAPVAGVVPPQATRWQDAPLLDVGMTVDPAAPRTVAVAGAVVEGRGGVVWRVSPGGRRQRLGEGTPLAATAGGWAVLAIAPRADAPAHAPPWALVLYVRE